MKKSFVAYIPSGYPDLETTKQILLKLDSSKVTAVEIGVPFSDPVADGPIIENAHNHALLNGTNLEKILEMLTSINVKYEKYLMSYLNPLVNFPGGMKKLKPLLEKAGISALVIPDLPVAEINNIKLDFKIIPFVAPNSEPEHIAAVNAMVTPWVYFVGRFGVTGTHSDLPFLKSLEKMKKELKHPVFLGFGVSNADQVQQVFKYADGVIVGSALVKLIDAKVSASINAETIFSAVNNMLSI
jgi:tryptophan synthase alpha chain